MNPLERSPVPVRELPESRREAIRSLLVAHAGGATPRSGPIRSVRWRLVVAGTLVALLATAQLWPITGDRSFLAAWTPYPQAIDAVTADDLANACVKGWDDISSRPQEDGGELPPVYQWEAVLVDRRGQAAMVLLATTANVTKCVYDGVGQADGLGNPAVYLVGGATGGGYASLPDGQVISSEGQGALEARHDINPFGIGGYYTGVGSTYGQVAPEVARVVVGLDDGTEVEATVADGWYAAFWPGRPGLRILLWQGVDVAWAATISAYDAAGNLLDQLEL